MPTYQISIVMLSGQFCIFTAEFESGADACIQCMEDFPEAKRISARRIK